MVNTRKGDHEEYADVAPAGRHNDSGSIKRVGEANSQSDKNSQSASCNLPLLPGGEMPSGQRGGFQCSTLLPWQQAILHTLDRNEISGFSEFETYGNYALENSNPILRPWQQKRLKRKHIADYDTLCRKYARPYRWTLTFPDYMKQS